MSIFNETLPIFVQNELNGRQNNLANRNNIYTFNSKTAWVRMTSGVNVIDKNGQESNQIAKNNVIFNILDGNTNTIGNPMVGYTTGNRHGIRPLPGINSLNCQSYAPNGSLRKVVVKFTIWDIEQLDLLEILYMRPGMSVCIEWGWSHKLADNTTNSLPNFGTKFLDMADAPLLDLHKAAYNEIKDNGGNFDICIGKVQNYSYSARTDGGYDCETTIVSYNEILDSFKINYIPLNMETTNNNATKPLITANSLVYNSSTDIKLQSKYAEGIIPGILYELYEQGLTDDQGGNGTIKRHTYVNNNGKTEDYTLFSLKLPSEVVNKMTDPDVIAQNATSIFIRFGDFVEILNNFVLYNNKSGPVTLVDIKGMKCVAHPFQFSTNPSVCLISADGWIDANQSINNAINNVSGAAAPPPTPPSRNNAKVNQLINEIRDDSDSTATFLSLVEDELVNGAGTLDEAVKRVWKQIADLNPTPVANSGGISYDFSQSAWVYVSPNGSDVKLNKFLNLTGGNINRMVELITNDIEYNISGNSITSAISSLFGGTDYPRISKLFGPFKNEDFELNVSLVTPYRLKSNVVNKIKVEFQKVIVDTTYSFNASTTAAFTQVAVGAIGNDLFKTISNLGSSSFFDPTDPNYRTGQIENIFLNVDYIYKLVKPKTTNTDDKNKKNEITFNQLMHNLLLEVQNSIGSINQFEIYGDGIETGKTQIIDRNYINPVKYTDLFSFELDNTSSTARNYSIRSQIFPEQSSIVAISTQAQSGKLGYNNKGLVNYNYGIKDRIVGVANSGAELTNAQQPNPRNHINQALSQLATAVNKLYIIPTSNIAS
jgi:hypothetical protein